MFKTIFFDLDGTLWPAKRNEPLLQAAWERLPYACNKVLGSLPPDVHWEDHKGSTDLGVVASIVYKVQPNSPNSIKLRYSILKEMDDYYLLHSPNSIKSLVYPDITQGLSRLRDEGWTLGVVTGNTRPVTLLKLKQAGLDSFFTPKDYLFTGDMSIYRSELLYQAWLNTLNAGKREEGVCPLIYVADTWRDFMESQKVPFQSPKMRMTNMEIRVLIRWSVEESEKLKPPWEQDRFINTRLTYFRYLLDPDFISEINFSWRFADVPPLPRS